MNESYEGVEAVLSDLERFARWLNNTVCVGLDITVGLNQYACWWKNVL